MLGVRSGERGQPALPPAAAGGGAQPASAARAATRRPLLADRGRRDGGDSSPLGRPLSQLSADTSAGCSSASGVRSRSPDGCPPRALPHRDPEEPLARRRAHGGRRRRRRLHLRDRLVVRAPALRAQHEGEGEPERVRRRKGRAGRRRARGPRRPAGGQSARRRRQVRSFCAADPRTMAPRRRGDVELLESRSERRRGRGRPAAPTTATAAEPTRPTATRRRHRGRGRSQPLRRPGTMWRGTGG